MKDVITVWKSNCDEEIESFILKLNIQLEIYGLSIDIVDTFEDCIDYSVCKKSL